MMEISLVVLLILAVFVAGFAAGFGIRSYISARRRWRARGRYDLQETWSPTLYGDLTPPPERELSTSKRTVD